MREADSARVLFEPLCGQFALAICVYTFDDPKIYDTLNTQMSSAGRQANNTIADQLRACLPFAKLLEVALSRLPSQYVFGADSPCAHEAGLTGRVWRSVTHVFPGYPGYVNPRPGSSASPQQHDPERHFAAGSMVCWYQFSSCSRNLQVMTSSADAWSEQSWSHQA